MGRLEWERTSLFMDGVLDNAREEPRREMNWADCHLFELYNKEGCFDGAPVTWRRNVLRKVKSSTDDQTVGAHKV